MGPKIVLTLIAPVAEALYKVTDLRAVLLTKICPVTINKFAKGFNLSIVSHCRTEEWNNTIVKFSWPGWTTPHYDIETFSGLYLQASPTRLGLEPYEQLTTLSDVRLPEEIVKGAELKNNELYINDKVYGEVISFRQFCKESGFDLTKQNVIDCDVVLVNDSYVCPERRRIVLRKGCVYGAPIYTLKFQYRADDSRKRTNLLNGLISDAHEDDSLWYKALQLHQQYLEQTSILTVSYEHSTERLLVNGRLVARLVPAKILRYLFSIYCTSSRSEYEYRELSRDQSILNESETPNLAIRIQRVEDLVHRKLPEIEMKKKGRGCFVFHPKGQIVFNEVELVSKV